MIFLSTVGLDNPNIKNGSSVFGSGGGCCVEDEDDFRMSNCRVNDDDDCGFNVGYDDDNDTSFWRMEWLCGNGNSWNPFVGLNVNAKYT